MFKITPLDNEIVHLSLDHGKVNAMDIEFCQQLVDQLVGFENDSSCSALVLSGNGRVFSAGIDLVRLVKEETEYLDTFLPLLEKLFEVCFGFSKPLVGLINGHAIAGGCVVACACDYRVVQTDAKIGIPELRVGVPFPVSGLEIMRFTATPHCFRQIVNNGMTFTNQELVNAGLADEIAEPEKALAAATKIAGELTQIPAEVFTHTKAHVRSVAWERIHIGLDEFGERINAMWRTQAVRDAIKDYVARKLKK